MCVLEATGDSSHLDHATECLRTLEIVTCVLKQSAGNVAT